MRAAGIDLGSNSFRLLVTEVAGREFTVLRKELETVRLAQGLLSSRQLSSETMAKAFEVLRWFKKIISSYEPLTLRICGTEALRKAGNAGVFLTGASECIGAPIEIISGEEEARLALRGALLFTDVAARRDDTLVVDVGGGSTELICSGGGADGPEMFSLPLGAVGLTEAYIHHDPPGPDEIRALSSRVRSVLEEGVRRRVLDLLIQGRKKTASAKIVATGGTATALAAIDLGLKKYDDRRVQGHVLAKAKIDAIFQELSRMGSSQRNLLPGLEKHRGEIILAGITIYAVLLELLGRDAMEVSDAGLLEGIVLSLMPEKK